MDILERAPFRFRNDTVNWRRQSDLPNRVMQVMEAVKVFLPAKARVNLSIDSL